MNHRCAPFSAPPCCSSSAPTPLLGTWRPAARLFPHRLNSHRLTALSQLPVKLPPAPTPPYGLYERSFATVRRTRPHVGNRIDYQRSNQVGQQSADSLPAMYSSVSAASYDIF